MTGAERARVLRRAARILRSRNQELAELETRDTGKPIQETRVVDVVSGADCFEYFAGLAQTLSGEHIDLGPPGLRLYAARAAGRRRRHRRLELSVADRLLEGGAGARLRQCHDLQARRAHAVHRGQARGDLARGRRAARHFPSGAGFCRDRPAAHRASRYSQGLPHRRSRHRQSRDERCAADPQERHAGIGRQVASDRVRRCQSRQCCVRRAARRISIRPDQVCSNGTRVFVHRSDQGGISGAAGQTRQRHAHRRSDGSRHTGRCAGFRTAHAQGARLHRARTRRGRTRCSRAACG